MRKPALILMLLLPVLDLAWNLTHLNIGLVDFHGLAAFARGFALHGAWPATPYFPAGYPLLLIPFGWLGQLTGSGGILQGGYLLSAAGALLTLWAIHRLCLVFGLSESLAALAIPLVWLAPEFRVCAGSPSVDMLYTGLGAWFLAAAIAALKGQGGRWITLGLAAAPVLLLLLRYHSLILLLPVGLVLLVRRSSHLAGFSVVLATLLALGFNHASYRFFWHRPLGSVVSIQLRTGLGLDYNRLQPTRADFFENYREFAEHARSTPLLQDFTVREIAVHTGKSYTQFLRRPAVLLMLGLLLAGIVMRKRPEAAGWLLAVWVPLYCLALSPAYYTPRAAVLPSSIAVVLLMTFAAALARRPGWKAACWVCGLLLLTGYVAASRFALADYRERLQFAAQSKIAADWITRQGFPLTRILSLDSRLLPTRANPWLLPYGRLRMSWLDDPEIDGLQLPDFHPCSRADLRPAAARRPAAILATEPVGIIDAETLLDSAEWERLDLGSGLSAYLPVADSATAE